MNNKKQDKVVQNIAKMEKAREERRQAMDQKKIKKAEKEQLNKLQGKNVDIDFEQLIDQNRFKEKFFQNHIPANNVRLCVCVRKRPLFQKEEQKGEIDCISCANPSIRVHAPKTKVDGITKYVENTDFTFDNTFNYDEANKDVYTYSLQPMIELMCNGGIMTVIAYGQTGSGKTFTMTGIQNCFINDLFQLLNSKYSQKQLTPYISFFEIYGGRLHDLLNNKAQLVVLEDKNNNVQIQGLQEIAVSNVGELQKQIEYGNSVRTTHSTLANDTSSRSHAICAITLKDKNEQQVGKVYLVDLAGSERAQDCQSNNRQRRLEGAEINKSLLALKECIRSMDQGATHIPFRASKLTLVLRDSFQSRSNNSKIIMIACISPGSSSADHTINTLRYVDRLKEKTPVIIKANNVSSQPAPVKPQKVSSGQQEEQKQNFHRKESPIRSQQDSQSSSNQNNSQQEQVAQKKPNAFHKQSSPRNSKEQKAPSSGNLAEKQAPATNNNAKRPSHSEGNNSRPPIQAKQPSNSNLNKGKINSNNGSQQNTTQDNSDDESPDSPKVKGVKDDVRCMKETLKMEKVSQEFFDFHDKVGNILDQQQEIFVSHMAAIKEDAKLLTQESELISNVQGVGFMDYDIDEYAKNLDAVIKKKLKIYNLLAKKLDKFKKCLKEEEEISNKVKDTFYY